MDILNYVEIVILSIFILEISLNVYSKGFKVTVFIYSTEIF